MTGSKSVENDGDVRCVCIYPRSMQGAARSRSNVRCERERCKTHYEGGAFLRRSGKRVASRVRNIERAFALHPSSLPRHSRLLSLFFPSSHNAAAGDSVSNRAQERMLPPREVQLQLLQFFRAGASSISFSHETRRDLWPESDYNCMCS